MKCICAWCLKQLAPAPETDAVDSGISHGICEECINNVQFQTGVALQKYLDSFAIPILLVDEDVRVLGANHAASALTGKNALEIMAQLAGNVFECKYARLPEGCGKTIHCSGCAIRQAVTKCITTGEPQVKIPAYLNPAESHSLTLTITAVKMGSAVALRIEEIAETAAV